MIKLLFIIGTGSFLGGISRFLVSRFIQNTAISADPHCLFSLIGIPPGI
ncbi:MAG: hypothetical protein V5A59_11415 [Bacteroidales bacterium]